MKRIYFIGIVVSALGLVMGPRSTAQQNADRVTVPLSDPPPGPALVKVRQDLGDITVKAYDGKEVIVVSKSNGGFGPFRPPDSNGQGLHRIGDRGGPAIEQENNVVSISSGMPPGNIDLQVPRKTNLSLSTVNGQINIEAVDGEIEANNTNGGVTLKDVSGSILAHSVNGRVTGSVKRTTPDKPMAFTSFNAGGVDDCTSTQLSKLQRQDAQ